MDQSSEPQALMGIWFETMREPYVDVFPAAEIATRQRVGWLLIALTRDIPHWWSSDGPMNLQRNPVRRVWPKDYGEQ